MTRTPYRRLTCRRLEDRTVPSTFTVTNLLDAGPGSLRQAIASANSNPGDDGIVFQPGLTGQITLTTGQLSITDGVTINGPGIVVSGNDVTRVFNTTGAPAGAKITLVTMTIRDGKVAGDGAGLLADDQAITLVACTITACRATGSGGDGGGVAVVSAGGSLNLFGCSVVGNQASGDDGGGVYLGVNTTASVFDCVISGNQCAGEGGGIHAVGGSLTIVDSTLAGNAAVLGGGLGFRATAPAGGLVVRNSTVSGNTATGTGGGIALVLFSGTLTVQNATVADNNAGGAGGGGIGRDSGSGTIALESSVVAGNTHTAGGNEDLFSTGSVTAQFSAVGTAAGVTTFTPDATTQSLLGANLKLGPLAANGGFTQTHVPAEKSPLINRGSNPAALTTDQRGGAAARDSSGGVDIGAVELQRFVVVNSNDKGAGSLRTAVINANTFGGADTVAFDPAAFASPQTITLTTGEMVIDDSVTVAGPAARVTLSGNKSSRVFNADGKAAPGMVVLLRDLNMADGNATGLDSGGAVVAEDVHLTMQNCNVTGSTVVSFGGAVYVRGAAGSLLVEDCVISGNTSDNMGGGLASGSSPTVIRRSVVENNSAPGPGGGIAVVAAPLTVESSTISGNVSKFGSIVPSTVAGGGGIYFAAELPHRLTMTNSTVSANTASKAIGGGVCVRQRSNFVTAVYAQFQNCTITANSANSGGGGIAGSGATSLTLASTVVAANTAAAAPDLSFTAATTVGCSDSLVGVADSGNFKLAGAGNQPGSMASPLNPGLGPLAENGGPTLTHALLPGSPAIDKGGNPGGLFADQRGGPTARVVGVRADVGAFEVQTLVTNANDAGAGSLRQALAAATFQPGADTINFDPAFFATPRTIKLTSGELSVSDAVSIVGPGLALVTVSGNNASRVFNTTGAPANAAIAISGLTVTDGVAIGTSGGGLLIGDESVTLSSCVVNDNTASEDGGGMAVLGAATLTLSDCTVSDNTAASDGGGMSFVAAANLVIRRSTVHGNSALSSGGGIYQYGGGSLLLEDSTISSNSAGQIGGGICFLNDVSAGGFVVRNSTLSGNVAGTGGGVLFSGLSGSLVIQNSTVTANTATGPSDGGGGVFQSFPFATMTVESSIIAGNTNPTVPDLRSGGTVNLNFSAVGSPVGFTPTGSNNVAFGTNLKLGALAENGGPTATHRPGPDSPLRNAGSNPAGLAFDQRLQPRLLNGQTDIGSVETPVPPPQVTSVVVNGGSAQRSRVTEITVTFSTIVSFNPTPRSSFSLARVGGGFIGDFTAVANVVGGKTVVTIAGFTGAETQSGSLADGRFTLTASATRITAGGQQLDGNGDGNGGDNFVLAGDPAIAPKLFRLFGDADGDGDVDAVDYGQFRTAFGGSSNLAFDFDNDGDVDAVDLGQFRPRFGSSI